jgi:hypothetical protein
MVPELLKLGHKVTVIDNYVRPELWLNAVQMKILM